MHFADVQSSEPFMGNILSLFIICLVINGSLCMCLGVAQSMLQVLGLWNDAEHEEL